MVLDFMFKVLLVSYPILGHHLGWCVPEKKKDVNKLACEGGAIAGNIFLMGLKILLIYFCKFQRKMKRIRHLCLSRTLTNEHDFSLSGTYLRSNIQSYVWFCFSLDEE